jgi:proteasome accessory factor B
MMVLHAQLSSGLYPNCRRMGALLEVSSKTIQRDLEFMRDRLALPIEYDGTRTGYFYSEPVTAFPAMEVTSGEVVALCVAQMALAQYEGTSFQRQLSAALRKLTESLQDKISFSFSELDESISFRSIGTTEADMQAFEQISHAVLESLELRFEYHKLGGVDYEPRRVDPYHLGCIENQWYMIGHDLDRDQLRTFALTRMRAVRVTKTHFRRPASFSIKDHLGGSFGVFTGRGRVFQIRIRFDAIAGQLVRERCWHSSQKLTPLPDGALEMSLELCSLREIERWILSWGARARVLSPPELVERVKSAAAGILQQYV